MLRFEDFNFDKSFIQCKCCHNKMRTEYNLYFIVKLMRDKPQDYNCNPSNTDEQNMKYLKEKYLLSTNLLSTVAIYDKGNGVCNKCYVKNRIFVCKGILSDLFYKQKYIRICIKAIDIHYC